MAGQRPRRPARGSSAPAKTAARRTATSHPRLNTSEVRSNVGRFATFSITAGIFSDADYVLTSWYKNCQKLTGSLLADLRIVISRRQTQGANVFVNRSDCSSGARRCRVWRRQHNHPSRRRLTQEEIKQSASSRQFPHWRAEDCLMKSCKSSASKAISCGPRCAHRSDHCPHAQESLNVFWSCSFPAEAYQHAHGYVIFSYALSRDSSFHYMHLSVLI